LFPVTVETDAGPVTIEAMPTQIISLSPTATENLFAIGAGDQVVAVDDYSYYPAEAPVTDLSGFAPNVEAILSYSPDLLVIAGSPDDLQAAVEAVGIPVLLMGAAVSIDGVYTQIERLGLATGHADEASAVAADMQTRIASVTGNLTNSGTAPTYYHELDPTYYSVTSETFIGQVYGLLGLDNIADASDPDGYGFPQLSEEYIVDANPDFIFLADAQCCGESADTVAARAGWDTMDAVTKGRVVEVDADIASRWGPRTADFIEAVAAAISEASDA
jgi:iron complex transport system substrate-binding protein